MQSNSSQKFFEFVSYDPHNPHREKEERKRKRQRVESSQPSSSQPLIQVKNDLLSLKSCSEQEQKLMTTYDHQMALLKQQISMQTEMLAQLLVQQDKILNLLPSSQLAFNSNPSSSSSSFTISNLSVSPYSPILFRPPKEMTEIPVAVWDNSSLSLLGCNCEFTRLTGYEMPSHSSLQNPARFMELYPQRTQHYITMGIKGIIGSGAKRCKSKTVICNKSGEQLYVAITFHLEKSFFWTQMVEADTIDDEFQLDEFHSAKTFSMPATKETIRKYKATPKSLSRYMETISRATQDRRRVKLIQEHGEQLPPLTSPDVPVILQLTHDPAVQALDLIGQAAASNVQSSSTSP